MDIHEIIFQCLTYLVVLIGTYLGVAIKRAIVKHLNDKTKKSIASIVVSAVEQVSKEIHGVDKLAAAELKIINILNSKGIKISSEELDALIEDAVRSMNASELKKELLEDKEESQE